jgi:hypothetical protein
MVATTRYTDRVTRDRLRLERAAPFWVVGALAVGACGGRASTDTPWVDGGSDATSAADGAAASAPRPIAPLSTATTTSQHPTFRWALAEGTDGAQVDVCRDRACSNVVTTFVANGTSGSPSSSLAAGLYFWRLHGVVNGEVGSNVSAVWEVTIGARSAPVDTSWGGGPDVNGDGYADMIVGAFGQGTAVAGSVYVYLGGADGIATTPAVTLDAPAETDEWFGSSVVNAGDVNGDGYADLAITNVAGDQSGAALVYLGGPAGTATVPSASLAPFGGSFLAFPEVGVASAGDVNGDGYGDLLVPGVCGAECSGGANLYLGGERGVASTPVTSLVGARASGAQYTWFSIACAGDVDGDGYADIVIGSGADASSDVGDGRVDVFLGAATGPSAMSSTTIASPSTTESFGLQVGGAGDVDGDGIADVLVGSKGGLADLPTVFVFTGTTSGLSSTASTTIAMAAPANGDFGAGAATAGDVNGDGYADLVVTSPGYSVEVFLGGMSGTPSSPSVTLLPPSAADGAFGYSFAGVGDVNGDGFADLAIGSTASGSNDGTVRIFLGSASGTSTSAALRLMAPAGADGAWFGSSIAE